MSFQTVIAAAASIALLTIYSSPVSAKNATADQWHGPQWTPSAEPSPPSRAVRGSNILWDNGNLVTHPGQGPGGSDASIIHATTFGFGAQIGLNNALADDFTIPRGIWDIDRVTVYAYQSGSGVTPTINDLRLQIWSGRPGDQGSSVVWGNLTSNVLDAATFTGVYRVQTLPGDTVRPVMALRANVDTVLSAGQYWIEWQAGGTLASGPFSPSLRGTGSDSGGQRVGSNWSFPPSGTSSTTGDEFAFLVEGSDLGGGGFDCRSLVQVVGTWGESAGRCGNLTSNATTPKFESARLDSGVTIAESRGGPMGYIYTVEAVVNRPRQRTAANSIFVHGTPNPLQSGSQWWNRKLAFNISGDGRYSIFRYNGTARPAAIQAWTQIIGASVAAPPATNTLQVVSNGSTLSFVLNGVTLRTINSEFAVEDFGIGFVRSVPGTGSAADDWIEIVDATTDAGTLIEGGDTGSGVVSAEQEAANLRGNSADQLQVADPFFAPGETTRPRK